MSYFRSLAYGVNPPPNSTTEPSGAVLWFTTRPTGYLKVIAELAFAHADERTICTDVLAIDAEQHAGPIEYTLAAPDLFPKKTLPGMVGEYVSDRFSRAGVPLVPADPDVVNGWARVHSMLRDGPSGEPWLTIHPRCSMLIKHLANAMSDETKPDDLAVYSPLLVALRFGVMAQPSHQLADGVDDPAPYGTMRYFMQKFRESEDRTRGRQFGQTR